MADTEYIHPSRTYYVSAGYADGQLIRFQYYNRLSEALRDAGVGTLIISYDPVEDYTAVSGVKVVFLEMFDENIIAYAEDQEVGTVMKVMPDPSDRAHKVWLAEKMLESITYVIQYDAGADLLNILPILDTTGRECQNETIENAIATNAGGFSLFPDPNYVVSLSSSSCMIPVLNSVTHIPQGYIIAEAGVNLFRIYDNAFALDKLDLVLDDLKEYIFTVNFTRV